MVREPPLAGLINQSDVLRGTDTYSGQLLPVGGGERCPPCTVPASTCTASSAPIRAPVPAYDPPEPVAGVTGYHAMPLVTRKANCIWLHSATRWAGRLASRRWRSRTRRTWTEAEPPIWWGAPHPATCGGSSPRRRAGRVRLRRRGTPAGGGQEDPPPRPPDRLNAGTEQGALGIPESAGRGLGRRRPARRNHQRQPRPLPLVPKRRLRMEARFAAAEPLHCGRAAHRGLVIASRDPGPTAACRCSTATATYCAAAVPAACGAAPPSASATGTWTAPATWWPPQVRHVVARPGRRRSPRPVLRLRGRQGLRLAPRRPCAGTGARPPASPPARSPPPPATAS